MAAPWALADATIPAGRLDDALFALGRQTGISIVFPPRITRSIHTEGVSVEGRGDRAAMRALDIVLREHCLQAKLIAPALIAVRERCPNTTNPDPAEAKATIAFADEPLPPGVEEIVVSERALTGSRLRNPTWQGSSQVDIIERSEIDSAGAQGLDKILRYIPAVSGNSTSTLISNGGDGSASVTLRGLPASNTLVLLNGRRVNADASGAGSVDLNTLPLALVKRVEILKDGASALYGSDAVAGVVNVITRQDIEGIHIDTYFGASGQDDHETQHTSLLAGRRFANGQFTLGASYYDQNELASRDRKLSASSDDRARGGIDKRSSATAPARVAVGGDALILSSDALDGSDASHFRTATTEDRFEYRDATSSIVPSRRWSGFADVRGFVGDWEVFTEILFSRNTSATRFAPAPLFTGFETIALPIAAEQPFNPFDVELTDVRRRMVELGDRVQSNESRSRRIVAGLQGTIRGVDVEVLASSNRTRARQEMYGGLNAFNTRDALSRDCVAPCVPLNLFGPAGSVTQEMVEFIRADTTTHSRSDSRALTLNLDTRAWQLPAGSIEFAAGAEYREEGLRVSPDALTAAGGTLGAANIGPTNGERTIWEVYAEAYVPLLRASDDRTLLDMQLAGRVSHYSDFGRASNPRIAFRLRPSPTVTFRASYAHGFRSPTLKQLFGGTVVSFQFLNDPCARGSAGDDASSSPVLPGCPTQSDSTLTQVLTRIGGDAGLKPETSRSLNVGLSWTGAGRLEGLTASLDAWRIRQRNVVDSSAQYIINENARSGRFSERVPRSSDGNITNVDASLLNIGTRDVSGVDLSLAYRMRGRSFGQLDFAFNAAHIARFADRFDPDSERIDQAGLFTDEASGGNGALPDLKANIGVQWRHRHWAAAYTLHFVNSLSERVPIEDTRRTIDSWITQDIQASYGGPATADVRVTLGLDNAFDAEPPFAAAAFNDSYDARTYDITGRFWYLRLDRLI
ncbi:MAG: TonB-dependent receptor [Pseudomonadaceae bacterium]|nr:TonB-dependent receptor [Pseudomonadaceae bacterium]